MASEYEAEDGYGRCGDRRLFLQERREGKRELYRAAISNAEIEKWEMLEIAYHPDGNARDMKKMQIALNGPVKMK